MLVSYHNTTWHHNPDDLNVNLHFLKSHILYTYKGISSSFTFDDFILIVKMKFTARRSDLFVNVTAWKYFICIGNFDRMLCQPIYLQLSSLLPGMCQDSTLT